MVEVSKRGGLVRVVFKNGLHPWDVAEYLLDDLMDECSGSFDSFSLHGVEFENTPEGLLVNPGDNFLFVRPTKKLRLSWSGGVLLTRDAVIGKDDLVLIGSCANHRSAA
jgi:hypothetical protein